MTKITKVGNSTKTELDNLQIRLNNADKNNAKLMK